MGTLRVSEGELPTSLNPMTVRELPVNLLFESLVLFNPKIRLVPRLLTRIPTLANHDVRAGGRVVVLRLKHGLQWSNGMEITSRDIRFGWLVHRIAGQCSGACAEIGRIDTPDRYTAVWHLTKPRPLIACPCQQPPLWPHTWPGFWKDNPQRAARRIYSDPSFTFLGPQYPTDGPYQVTQYLPHKRIVFRPMKYYHVMNCGALINKIVMVEYPSKAALVAAAAAGTVDATWNWDNRYVPLLHRSRSFTTHTIPTDGVDGLVFNEDSSYRGAPNPLANVKVRQALALAVDKVRMTQLAYGVGRATARRFQAWNVWVNMPSYRIFAPYLDRSINGQWDPIDQRYRSDTGSPDAVSHARKLLAQTPWERGFPLDLYVFSPENCGVPFRCAEAAALGSVEADWKKLGVSVHTHYISAQTLGAPWQQGGIEARGAFQATLLIWSTGDPYDWRPLFDSRLIERDRTDHSGPPLCCNAGVRDQAIDRAFDRAGSPSVSMAVRRQMYGFIQRRLNHQVHALPMYYWMATSTTNKHARTLTFGPNLNASWQNGQFWNPYAWRVQSG